MFLLFVSKITWIGGKYMFWILLFCFFCFTFLLNLSSFFSCCCFLVFVVRAVWMCFVFTLVLKRIIRITYWGYFANLNTDMIIKVKESKNNIQCFKRKTFVHYWKSIDSFTEKKNKNVWVLIELFFLMC